MKAESSAQLRTDQYSDSSRLAARIALHDRFSTNPQGWSPWLFEQIDVQSDAKILELGCGAGTLWSANHDRIPSGWELHLSDFSPGMLEDARQNLAGVSARFSFEVVDATDIPHGPDGFDAVFANHMLYHVENRPRALAEIARVLRPGGLLMCSTLSDDMMFEMYELVRLVTKRSNFSKRLPSSPFSLENGRQQLSPYFADVDLRLYEDSLRITEPGPMLDYLRSMILDEPLTEEELASVEHAAAEVISEHGAFAVRKNSGAFLAHPARSTRH